MLLLSKSWKVFLIMKTDQKPYELNIKTGL